MQLRPYQTDIKVAIQNSWSRGARNVVGVLPTGAGKTVVFSDIIRNEPGAVCAIAHRQELVSQISLALARNEVRHRIVGPNSVVRLCVNVHVEECGRSFYSPSAPVAVAGVDTLVRRGDQLKDWSRSVSLWVMDEAHHLLRANKWGSAVEMFPNARGLGVTATPERADGKGLGAHADGVFHDLCVGPDMGFLIAAGFLSPYRIFAPPSDLRLDDVKISSSTGDYTLPGLKLAVRRSRIVGDVVAHYLRLAAGKLGVTFATDVETATDIAAQFNAAGVPAKVVSAKTPDADRFRILRAFRNRQLLQLVNVDLFGEGFDLPAIEVMSMARPTESYPLFVQQFGRPLRPLDGKDKAIIIDHVGNVTRHGLPDAPRAWTLDARPRSRRDQTDAIPVRTCVECFSVYERVYPACPFCGAVPKPASRSGPEFVDGDLLELDDATLERLRGQVAAVDMPVEVYRAHLVSRNVPHVGQLAHVKRHAARQAAQSELREAIAWWAGYQRALGRPDSESYRRFFFAFGVDVMTAQTLGITEAAELTKSIKEKLTWSDASAARLG